jgi:hypothetical protein
MVSPVPAPVALHSAADVARALRCSEWWVKEQARRRRIPFCWIGGSYRFTGEHLAEIVRLCEVRPAEPTALVARAESASRDSVDVQDGQPVVVLQARPPRRARRAGTPDTSAA